MNVFNLQDEVVVVVGPSVLTEESEVKDLEDPDPDEVSVSNTVVFWLSEDKSSNFGSFDLISFTNITSSSDLDILMSFYQTQDQQEVDFPSKMYSRT